MEVYNVLGLLTTFTLMCGVKSYESTDIYSERLDFLEEEMETFPNRFNLILNQMSIDKSELKIEQKRQMRSLKRQLKSKTRRYVTEILSEIIGGDSFGDMIKSLVISEMVHLKKANHHMKVELHQMMKSLGQVEADNRMYKEALQKGEKGGSELMTGSRYLISQLAQRDRKIKDLENKLRERHDSYSASTNTSNKEADSVTECSKCLYSEIMTNRLIKYDRQISELNQTLMTENKSCKDSKKTLNEETDSASETTTPTSSTASSTTAVVETTPTTRLTTSEPQPERSRILIAPMWSSSHHQFRQVDIHSNTLDIYSYLNLKRVDSVLYISKINTLLIGVYSPYKIISSTLHGRSIKTVRGNVRTYGMAADEKIGVVFLTTLHPSRTISRMSLQGKHFTTLVSLSGYGFYPCGIAVHPHTRVIYACNIDKLFTVRYDGNGLTTLTTGSVMFAVTLDISNGLLYYGNDKRLMKMSLSSNTSSEVTQFSFYIWNLIFYRDTVYSISYNKSPGTLGAVDVGQNIVFYTLQTVKVSGVSNFAICLIP